MEHQQPRPGPEHEVLEVIIGKWINEGHTVGPHGGATRWRRRHKGRNR